MLAARADQENRSYEQQTFITAKPVNRANGPLGAPTPVNKLKTPFRHHPHDENAVYLTGRPGSKTNGIVAKTSWTVGKRHDAFVTPAGPRSRAPLGAKTTNAGARNFQTPAPAPVDCGFARTQIKSISPRLRRPKVSIHEERKATTIKDDDISDVEYMPPRSRDLIDTPDDDFGHDKTYPMFEGDNMTKGWISVYMKPVRVDGTSQSNQRQLQAEKAFLSPEDRMINESINRMDLIGYNIPEDPEVPTLLPTNSKPVKPANGVRSKGQLVKASQGPSTIISKNAAELLSQPARPANNRLEVPKTGRFKEQRIVGSGSREGFQPTDRSLGAKHTAAVAVSRNTIGYAKRRPALSALRQPSTQESTLEDPIIVKGSIRNKPDLTASSKNHRKSDRKVEGDQSQETLKLIKDSIGGATDHVFDDWMQGCVPEYLLQNDEALEDFVLCMQ